MAMDRPARAHDEVTPHVTEEQGQHARLDTTSRHRPGTPDVVEPPGQRLRDAQVLRGEERELAVWTGIDDEVRAGQSRQLAKHQVRAHP